MAGPDADGMRYRMDTLKVDMASGPADTSTRGPQREALGNLGLFHQLLAGEPRDGDYMKWFLLLNTLVGTAAVVSLSIDLNDARTTATTWQIRAEGCESSSAVRPITSEILPDLSDEEFTRYAYMVLLKREPDKGRMRLLSEGVSGLPSREAYIEAILTSKEFNKESKK